jgi:hypothetical protein
MTGGYSAYASELNQAAQSGWDVRADRPSLDDNAPVHPKARASSDDNDPWAFAPAKSHATPAQLRHHEAPQKPSSVDEKDPWSMTTARPSPGTLQGRSSVGDSVMQRAPHHVASDPRVVPSSPASRPPVDSFDPWSDSGPRKEKQGHIEQLKSTPLASSSLAALISDTIRTRSSGLRHLLQLIPADRYAPLSTARRPRTLSAELSGISSSSVRLFFI